MAGLASVADLRLSRPRLATRYRVYAGLLILYLVGISAFNREFARLHISIYGIPLFTGEAVIAVLSGLLLLGVIRDRRLPIRIDATATALLLYLGVGVLFSIRGLLAGYGLAVFRDFALVYYLVFFFFAEAFIRFTGRPGVLVLVIVLGGLLGSAVAVVDFAVSPRLVYGHGASGQLGLVAWLMVTYVVLFWPRDSSLGLRAALAGALMMGSLTVFLTGYRTLLGSVLASLAVLWVSSLASSKVRRAGGLRWAAIATGVVMALAASSVAIVLSASDSTGARTTHGKVALAEGAQTVAERWLLTIAVVEWNPGLTDEKIPADVEEPPIPDSFIAVEPSLAFREAAWRNALARIGSSPLLGIGFGPAPELYAEVYCAIPSSPVSNCGNAHNTYLTLAMRMGIPVLLLFLSINGYVLYHVVRAVLMGLLDSNATRLAIFSIIVFLSFSAFALMSLFLESPYLSALYWVIMAVMHHLGFQRAAQQSSSAT